MVKTSVDVDAVLAEEHETYQESYQASSRMVVDQAQGSQDLESRRDGALAWTTRESDDVSSPGEALLTPSTLGKQLLHAVELVEQSVEMNDFLEEQYLSRMQENVQLKLDVEKLNGIVRQRDNLISQLREDSKETNKSTARPDAQIENLETRSSEQESTKALSDALKRSYEMQLKQILEYQTLVTELKFEKEGLAAAFETRYKGIVDRLEETVEASQAEITDLRSQLDSKSKSRQKSTGGSFTLPLSGSTLVFSSDSRSSVFTHGTATKKASKATQHRRPVLDPNVPGGVPKEFRGKFITQGDSVKLFHY